MGTQEWEEWVAIFAKHCYDLGCRGGRTAQEKWVLLYQVEGTGPRGHGLQYRKLFTFPAPR